MENGKAYVLTLQTGQQFTFVVEGFDLDSFLKTINNPQIFTVAVGEVVFNRQLFGTLLPKEAVASEPAQA